MSVKLFKSDNLSIVGEYQEKPGYKDMASKKEAEIRRYLQLHFTMHVNGKIKTFTHYLSLIEEKSVATSTTSKKNKDTIEEKYITLENWNEWYILQRTLGEIGYVTDGYTPDEALHPAEGGGISGWIEKTVEEFKNKDSFHYN